MSYNGVMTGGCKLEVHPGDLYHRDYKTRINTDDIIIATHIKKGLYSDGSYYNQCDEWGNWFRFGEQYGWKNRHPKKDQYEKTEWQNARDECLELTYIEEKREGGYWGDLRKKLIGLYNDCLKERGF